MGYWFPSIFYASFQPKSAGWCIGGIRTMKNFLQIVLFLVAIVVGACVEIGTDNVPPSQLVPITVKDFHITVTEGDTVFLNLNDSIIANRTYSLKVIPNRVGLWNSVNDSMFSYICTPGYWGADTAYFEVCPPNETCIKGTINITIIKREIPCVPVAKPDVVNGRINQPIFVNVLQNDSLCGNPYSISFSGFTGGGNLRLEGYGFRFIQDSNYVVTSRPIQFQYTVCDYEGKCATSIVTINPQNRRDFCAEKYQLNSDYIISDDSAVVFNWESLLRNDRFCPQDLIQSSFFIAPISAGRSFAVERVPGSNICYAYAITNKRRPFVDSVLYSIPSVSYGPSGPKRAHLVIRFN